MKLKKWVTIAALLLPAGVPVGAALAETATPAPAAEEEPAPVVDEQADGILRKMSDFLAAQQKFRLHSTRSMDLVLDNGMKVQTDSSAVVAIQRPQGIHVIRKATEFDQHIYYDGEEVTLYRTTGLFASAGAPATIDEFLDRAIERLGLALPSIDLIYSNPYKVLTEDRIAGVYLGEVMIEGVKCHHLAFRNQNVDWQIWVEDGARPLPHKMVVTARDTEQAPQFVARFTNWDLNPTFAANEFTFAMPADAVRIGIANAEAFLAN